MRNEYVHQQLKTEVEFVQTLDSSASIFACFAAEGDVHY